MKKNLDKYMYLIQLLILVLFFVMTLLNEEFDLPHHLLGDSPVSMDHRHGEMFIEFMFFFLIVLVYYVLNNRLLKKIRFYEQQKEMFERTFYHDIHNTAVVLHGFASRLHRSEQEKLDTCKNVLYQTSRQLLEEIETQRDISHAEKDELPVHPQQINSLAVLSEVVDMYKNHSLSRKRRILIDQEAHSITLTSDRTLIRRVLGNMVKNALEASQLEETITLGCSAVEDQIEFYVHNPNFIPKDIQKRIFNYSFSTKGKGRGIGTYSMKLLGEEYLNGKISFLSSAEDGTTFKACFPLQYKP